MKHEWRKKEQEIYLPKPEPQYIEVPAYTYLTIAGEGNPNDPFFADYITALYSLSYAIKMTLKKGNNLSKYNDYTVYPLEGVWDINQEAKKRFKGTIDKNDLAFNLMIRQPDFVSETFFHKMLAFTQKKKPQPLLA